MIDTCAIWGTTNYVNGWLSINILVILISLMAVAVGYTLSNLFPASMKGRLKGFIRFEMIQLLVSILILGLVLALSATACGLSANVSSSLTHKQMDPFAYSEYYISSTFNTGLALLSNIYSTGISYAVYSSIIRALPGTVLRGLNVGATISKGSVLGRALTKTAISSGPGGFSGGSWLSPIGTLLTYGCQTIALPCEYESIPSVDLSYLFNQFATMYLAVFSPILVIAAGLMFIQFLAIPVMQFSAFTIVLPVALALRSVAFFSTGLGDASNALIALAIALYIIYPMMIAFDGYAISWVFSANNPSAQYAGAAFTVNSVAPNSFFQTQPQFDISGANALASEGDFVLSALSASGSYNYAFQSLNLIGTLRNYTNAMAQFFFESILLFALNMAVTVGLAVSLYKALKTGLGEAGRFW